MESAKAKTQRVMLYHDARAILDSFLDHKDKFARAYKIRNFKGMRAFDTSIRSEIRAYASLFACSRSRRKRQTSMDLKEARDLREDQRIINYVNRLRALATSLDHDVSVINLFDFCRHVDQAESVMYRLLDRMRDIKENGINNCRVVRRQPKQSQRMKENFADWETWINSEKQTARDDISDILNNIEELERQFTEPFRQNDN